MTLKSTFLALACAFALAQLQYGQEPPPVPAAQDATASAPDTATAAPGAAEGSSETGLSRWFSLDAASFTIRYRNSFDTDGSRIFDDIQQRSLLAGKLKFDKDGKYFVGFRAESGRYFNWSFANFSGIGYGTAVTNAFYSQNPQRVNNTLQVLAADPQGAQVLNSLDANGWQFYVRDLYLSATPVKGVTVEFGGIPIERGMGSEITTYDEDGYISGERVRINYPDQLYLDQVEFTSAYLGDVFTPNFFDRYDRLTQSNYRQVLGEKHFGSRLQASADYTWLVGTHTFREALLAKTKESRILDSARVELPGTSLFGFYTHEINSKETPLEYSFTRQNLNFGLQLDFKTMLERAHVL